MADVRVRIGLNDDKNSHIEIDKTNGLKSIESLSQSTGQPKDVFYGSISNSGIANIFDIDGEIYDMVKGGVIENSNMPLDVFLNGNKIQSHISNDSSYNGNSKTFTVYMNDKISSWEELIFSGMPLTEGSKSAYEVLLYVMKSLGYNSEQIDNMLKNDVVYGVENQNGTILDYLKTIKIEYPYIGRGTYKEVIDKICSLAQLQVLCDNNGNPIFVSARPFITGNQSRNAIVIPQKYMGSNLEKTVILKNKYDKIELEETIVEKVTIDNSNCGNATVENEGYEIEGLGAEISISGYNVGIKLYFKTFTITIPAKTNLNLNTTYNITNFSSILNVGNNILVDNIKTYNFYPQGSTTPIIISPQVILDRTGINIDKEKINSVIYDSTNDTFTISFVACVGRDVMAKTPIYGQDDIIWDNQEYIAKSITFTFLGQQLQVQFNKSDVSESISNNPKTILKLNTNELLQSTTTIENVKMSTYIKNNVFFDYSNGVSDAKFELFCGDLYYSNGELAKDWSNGEIVEVGDIVKIPNNKMENKDLIFKVVGRTFKKQGVPLIDLELQEVNIVESFNFNLSGSFDINAPNKSASSYLDIYINDKLVNFASINGVYRNDKIVIKSKPIGSYMPTSATINNETYSFGSKYYVTGDVDFEITVRKVTITWLFWKNMKQYK